MNRKFTESLQPYKPDSAPLGQMTTCTRQRTKKDGSNKFNQKDKINGNLTRYIRTDCCW